MAAALRLLAEARSDFPLGLVYLTGADGQDARLVAGQGIGIDGELSTSVIPQQVRQAISTGQAVTATGLAGLLSDLSMAEASAVGDADMHTAVVQPLILVGRRRSIDVLVLGTHIGSLCPVGRVRQPPSSRRPRGLPLAVDSGR